MLTNYLYPKYGSSYGSKQVKISDKIRDIQVKPIPRDPYNSECVYTQDPL